MRNIRILVEFASVVMPGAVLLLAITALYASPEWIAAGSYNSAGGIAASIALSFALGHLLQGLTQILVEPLWRRLQHGGPVAWAVNRFAGCESRRFLTTEQLQQLDLQFPAKLGIPFPQPPDSTRRLILDCAVSHTEAFVETAKVADALEDFVTDLKLNKGLFTAFVLIALAIPTAAHETPWFALPGAVLAALAAFARMDHLNRKYTQGLFLVFLTTSAGREGGNGRGNAAGAAGGGAGGGGFPIPMGRGGSVRGTDTEDETH